MMPLTDPMDLLDPSEFEDGEPTRLETLFALPARSREDQLVLLLHRLRSVRADLADFLHGHIFCGDSCDAYSTFNKKMNKIKSIERRIGKRL